MRYLPSTKVKVRELRSKGYSLNQIHKITNVPISTICMWTGDIRLSEDQRNRLQRHTQKALQAGRIRVQLLRKEQKNDLQISLHQQGVKQVGTLTNHELLLVGVALYWAEGFKNKHEHRLGFCNSDPKMIIFYIKWLEKSFGVKKDRIIARLTLNESYRDKTAEIESYWLKIIGLSKNQFTKTFYQQAKWKKQFNDDNYHGVLRIHAKDSLNALILTKGFIEGMKLNVLK